MQIKPSRLSLLVLVVLMGLCGTSHALTSAQIPQLQVELNTDPKQLGYAADINLANDNGVADKINLVRSGADYQLNRGVIPTYRLLPEMVIADLLLLLEGTPVKMPLLQLYMGAPQIDTADPEVQGVFLNLFPAGSASRANLIAFFKRQSSRAEVLWGLGTVVTLDDISCALRNVNCP